MDGHSFYDKVMKSESFEWLGSREGNTPADDEVIVKDKKAGATFAVSIEAIKTFSWEELESVISGKRDAKIMMHITRIVGYFSQIRNWNRSKIAELKDRHKGNYAVESSPAPIHHLATPAPIRETALASA